MIRKGVKPMYKALIVDDEAIIRTGIRKVIPWDTLGIDEVFTASNGFEALKIIGEQKPHVLITDINMTEMTGLEMIERVREARSAIKIIVITGYDSFEYVHRCIKMHVEDFFLKPVDEDELTAAIKKSVDQLEAERQEHLLRRTQGSTEQLYLEKIMRDLIHGQWAEKDIAMLAEDYRIDTDEEVQAAILVPTLHDDGGEFRLLSTKNICTDLFDRQDAGITFQDEDGKIIIAVYRSRERGDAVERITQLSNFIFDEFGTKPKVVMGTPVRGMRDLSHSYSDAVRLLDTEEKTIHEIIQSHSSENRLQLFNSTFSDIKYAMSANVDNVETVLQLFHSFESAVELHNVSNSVVRGCCFELASSVCFSYALNSGKFTEGKLQALMTSLKDADRAEALAYTKTVLSQVLSVTDENIHDIVSQVKAIVNENLGESISVLSIAAKLYISPNYLSRLFK